MSHEMRATINGLWGPILDKELRVSSRLRRSYVLRFLYVLLLAGLIGLAWVPIGASRLDVRQVHRMADVGRALVTAFLVFQFVAAQTIAAVLLSTAVSDEILHRTLGVLMTTPITGLQIVMGKLLSRMVHVLVLLALGLPVLAMVRVFGGVPWGLVIASLGVTATAALFAGTVSLFFSIRSDRAYGAMLRTAVVLVLLYVFIPLMCVLALRGTWALAGMSTGLSGSMEVVLPYLNPPMALAETISPSVARGGPVTFHWPIHCLVMALASGLVVLWAGRHARRAALRQATGQAESRPAALEDRVLERLLSEDQTRSGEQVALRRVKGPPILWRELATPLLPGKREKGTIGLVVAVLVLLLLYAVSGYRGILDEDMVQVAYTELFLGLGLMMTLLLVSTAITAEKEAGTWPILLATPLTDRDVLTGKAAGALHRSAVVWAFLAGHVLVATALGYVHWIAIPQVAMAVTGSVALACGVGLYMGTRFRRTTGAVVVVLVCLLGLWVLVPAIVTLAVGSTHRFWARCSWLLNPFVQVGSVVTGGCALLHGETLDEVRYRVPPGGGGLGFASFMRVLAMVFGAYLLTGLGLMALAQRRLRRAIF